MKKMLIFLVIPILVCCQSKKRDDNKQAVLRQYVEQSDLKAKLWREKIDYQHKRFALLETKKPDWKNISLYDSLMVNCNYRLDTLQTTIEYLEKDLRKMKLLN